MNWRIGVAALFALFFLRPLCAGAQTAPQQVPAVQAPSTRAPSEGVIGTILEVEGHASVTPQGGQPPSVAAIDSVLRLNDTVTTGPGARVFILFIDNTEMTLSENTQVKVDDYVFDPDNDKDNRARYSVLEGAFQYVSGLIGHKADPDVKIETPVGSIGIRGTDFWAGRIDDHYGVAVNEGRVALKTQAGPETLVNKGEGTAVADRYHVPSRPQIWPRERLQRLAGTVLLQRRAFVMQRVIAMQDRQKSLRRGFLNYMRAHRRQGYWEQPREPAQGFSPAAPGVSPDTHGFRKSSAGFGKFSRLKAEDRQAHKEEMQEKFQEHSARAQARRNCLQTAATREERHACNFHKDGDSGGQ